MKKGILFVISGPSGVGKGSVIKRLVSLSNVAVSISATTRKPRDSEKDGVDYYFISKEEFMLHINDGDMVEYNEYCGNFYGTIRSKLEKLLLENEVVLLEIDVNGVEMIAKELDCVKLFLLPPSFEELKNRLMNRNTETQSSLEKRLKQAYFEIEKACNYDYIIENDFIDEVVEKFNCIVKAERLRFKNSKSKLQKILKS